MATKKPKTFCDRVRSIKNKTLLNLGFIFINTSGKNYVMKFDGEQLKSNKKKVGNYSMDDANWKIYGHRFITKDYNRLFFKREY